MHSQFSTTCAFSQYFSLSSNGLSASYSSPMGSLGYGLQDSAIRRVIGPSLKKLTETEVSLLLRIKNAGWGVCWDTNAELGELVDRDADTVGRALRRLSKEGELLIINFRKGRKGTKRLLVLGCCSQFALESVVNKKIFWLGGKKNKFIRERAVEELSRFSHLWGLAQKKFSYEERWELRNRLVLGKELMKYRADRSYRPEQKDTVYVTDYSSFFLTQKAPPPPKNASCETQKTPSLTHLRSSLLGPHSKEKVSQRGAREIRTPCGSGVEVISGVTDCSRFKREFDEMIEYVPQGKRDFPPWETVWEELEKLWPEESESSQGSLDEAVRGFEEFFGKKQAVAVVLALWSGLLQFSLRSSSREILNLGAYVANAWRKRVQGSQDPQVWFDAIKHFSTKWLAVKQSEDINSRFNPSQDNANILESINRSYREELKLIKVNIAASRRDRDQDKKQVTWRGGIWLTGEDPFTFELNQPWSAVAALMARWAQSKGIVLPWAPEQIVDATSPQGTSQGSLSHGSVPASRGVATTIPSRVPREPIGQQRGSLESGDRGGSHSLSALGLNLKTELEKKMASSTSNQTLTTSSSLSLTPSTDLSGQTTTSSAQSSQRRSSPTSQGRSSGLKSTILSERDAKLRSMLDVSVSLFDSGMELGENEQIGDNEDIESRKSDNGKRVQASLLRGEGVSSKPVVDDRVHAGGHGKLWGEPSCSYSASVFDCEADLLGGPGADAQGEREAKEGLLSDGGQAWREVQDIVGEWREAYEIPGEDRPQVRDDLRRAFVGPSTRAEWFQARSPEDLVRGRGLFEGEAR